MQLPSNMVIFIIIVSVLVLALVLLVWLVIRALQPASRTDEKTQPIVQKFYSDDLQRRAFIVRRNDGRHQVIQQYYSDKVISRTGETVGWTALPEKPQTVSLAEAVEIAHRWTHGDSQTHHR